MESSPSEAYGTQTDITLTRTKITKGAKNTKGHETEGHSNIFVTFEIFANFEIFADFELFVNFVFTARGRGP